MMFSIEQKLREIERELDFLRRAFPRWVAEGRMTQEEANTRLLIMEHIAADYVAALKRNAPTLNFE